MDDITNNKTSQQRQSVESPLILVVDDDAAIRLMLRDFLEEEGYQVEAAPDGRVAVELFAQLLPDVVLLDQMMPRMDGLTACARMKELPGGSTVPVLMITAVDDSVTVDAAFDAGATDFITKPLLLSVLRQRVRRLIEAKQAVEALEQQRVYEGALLAVIQELNRSSELQAVLDTALTQALGALRLEQGAIYLWNPEQELVLRSHKGFSSSSLQMGTRPDSVTEQAALTGEPLIRSTGPVEQIGEAPPDAGTGQYARASIPLRSGEEILGVMNLNTMGKHTFSQREIGLLNAIANQIGIALHRARLYEMLRHQAVRDPLTGLFNRRYMEESLTREIHRAARSEHQLAVIMLDLDRFKQFNDSFGHEAGDILLRELARLLQGQIRRGDIAARYGGEEFILILPEVSTEIAWQRAESIREDVKGLQVYLDQELLPPVTLSVGLALYPLHGESSRDVLRAADEALYRAKADGRDRVISATVAPA
jgi:diguanylate cyclase (GGDEF)-like protein